MKPSLIRAGFLALVVAIGIVACSSRPTDQAPSGSESASGGEHTGEVGYELRLGRTTHINKANYKITCPGGFAQSGTIDVSKLRELEGSIPNLPPGGPCTLTLTANSTNGNVNCSGSKSGLTVTCPGNRPQDETHLKLTCTRNHVGREWGDDDWRENARTFQLGAEVNLVCCVPKTSCPAGDNCGTIPDGCGGTLNCGSCPSGQTCNANACVGCVPITCANTSANCGPIPDGCGGFINCGTCPVGQACGAGGVANHCGSGCRPLTVCPPGQICGSAHDGCGGMTNCGTCPSGTCDIPDGGTAGTSCIGCTPVCSGKQCGPDGCGGTCGTCPSGQGCLIASGTCTACGVCLRGQNCGQAEDACFNLISCGTCAAGQVCNFGGNPAQCCVEEPASVACAGKNCGAVFDNCNIQVSCGTCLPGSTCSNPGSGGVCGPCMPQTTCPTGQTCGTEPDGCGGTLQCGTCASGQVCNAGSCCTPQAVVCPAGAVCGFAPDGCGGGISCGSCPTGQACGADGQCHQGCGANASTLSCLQTQDKPTSSPPLTCSTCVQANGCLDPALQGGTCEMVAGNANLFSGTLPDGRTCSQVVGPPPVSEAAICFQTLSGIFGSKCAAVLQLTPCFCGTTDPTMCTNGTAQPNGPLYDEYACDFNSPSGATIFNITTDFIVPTFGAGVANALVQCAGAFGCDCF